MAQDLDQFFKEIFGEPLSRLSTFSSEQMQKLNGKLQELAKEAVKDELAKLHSEIGELRTRLGRLESERAEQAADRIV